MFFKALWPAFLWSVFILIICGIPGQRLPPLEFLKWLKPDKIVHLFVFGMLSYLLVKGYLQQESFPFLKLHPGWTAFLFSAFYGVIIEILQEYVFIDRTGDVRDAIANAIGASLGVWFFYYRKKKKIQSG